MSQARYDRIGIGYNQTRKADPYIAKRLGELLRLQPAGSYLDVGCGTGNYTTVLADSRFSFIGLDPSEEMLSKARSRSTSIQWIQGSVESIPLESDQFDSVLASLTIHHWDNLNNGFQEVARVLKPGGRFVLFTTTPEQTGKYWLEHYFPKMIDDSTKILPSLDAINEATSAADLNLMISEKYWIQPDLEDLFLYCGKHDPRCYFDKRVRSGISSFSLIAESEEVESGLRLLKEDMDSGQFPSIAERYEGDQGDYLFLVFQK